MQKQRTHPVTFLLESMRSGQKEGKLLAATQLAWHCGAHPMPAPWYQYRVKENDFLNGECEEFTSIAHVTHVENALSIVRRGGLRPQLVYDESKLRKRRILVVWLSPNSWHDGFRYGNVSFDYSFSDVVTDKRFY